MGTPKTGWTTCPICNTRLKAEKLDGHIKHVHPKGVKTREERAKIVGRRKKASAATKWLVAAIIVVAVVFMIYFAYTHIDIRGNNVGSKPYKFTLVSTDGPTYSLDDHLGDTPILLGLMSSECLHCGKMADVFHSIYVNYSDRVEIVILISNDPLSTGQPLTMSMVKAFANEHDLQFSVLFDQHQTVYNKYTSDLLQPFYPTMCRINKQGKIDWTNKQANIGEYSYQELTAKLDKDLA